MRVVVPLDPSRYLELPWAIERLAAQPGQRVLDLASPKLLAVQLSRRGVRVTSVDQLEREVETWQALAGDAGVDFRVADGRALPFADATFDHAYSISVLEHIEEPGDAEGLRELARVVKPGGRVLVTLPHALEYREDWRDAPVYANEPAGGGRSFFQRWYDPPRVDALLVAAPSLELASREVVRMQPNWNDAYVRSFPWLVPLGPLYGVLGREIEAADGDVVRLAFVKR